MPLLLGQSHTTLVAPTEEELDRLIAAWQSRLRQELAEHHAHPEGIPVSVRSCEGLRTVLQRPSWLPSQPLSHPQLDFRFSAQKKRSGGRWLGYLCADLIAPDAPSDFAGPLRHP